MGFPWKQHGSAKLSHEEWLEVIELYENRKDLYLKDILARYETPWRTAPSRSRFYQIYRRWVHFQMTGKTAITLED